MEVDFGREAASGGPADIATAGRPRRRRRPLSLGETAFQGMELLRELVKRRKQLRLSQTQVATKMGTSQSAVARIEAGEIDIRLSTLDRYAAAVDQKIAFRVMGKTSARKKPKLPGKDLNLQPSEPESDDLPN